MSGPILQMRLRVPLDRFDLEVECETGERVVGLFGASGSGKTTWLEALAGIRRGVRGTIRFGDRVWLDSDRGVRVPPEARGIGYVPQDHLLFPHRDVRGNLAAGVARANRRGRGARASVDGVVEVLELGPLMSRAVGTLSGGERQRVALGRALCSGPELLMLDEPLASLDVPLRHRILPFLQRVRDRYRVPTIVVSHDPVELQALCDEVIALERGRVVAQGSPTAVFTRADVYPAAAAGFHNVLLAVVASHAEHTTVLRLGADGAGQSVVVPRIGHRAGDRVTLGIPAHDILAASSPVAGISARNRLSGRVGSVELVGHTEVVLVRLDDTDAPEVAIELTPDAVEEMSVAVGARIWLLVKSTSIAVLG